MKRTKIYSPILSSKVTASFDPSIPDWLRKEFNSRYSRLSGNRISKLFDLSKAKFLDYDSGNSLPIYHIDNIVYIPGVNDDDTVVVNGRLRKVGGIAKSKLPELADDVVFVDLEQAPPADRDRYEDPRHFGRNDRGHGYAGQKYSEYSNAWKTSSGRDKSGYKIPDPDKMLYDYYTQPGNIGKISNKLAETYDILNDLKSRIFSIDFSNPANISTDYYSTAYTNMLSRFGNAISYYTRAFNDVKTLISTVEKNGGEYNKDADTYYLDYSLRYILDNIRNAKSSAKEVEKYLSELPNRSY